MDRHTRKDLKTDKFVREVGHTVDYLSHHRAQAVRYGLIGLAVLVVAGGVYLYMGRQTTLREEALSAALRIDDATVGGNATPAILNFPTAEEKQKARVKALTDLVAKYPGTAEGSYAAIYLATDAADRGDLPDAEQRYRKVMEKGPSSYAGLARLSLVEVLIAEGKLEDAKKVLREAVAKPTATVSKEQSTVMLATLIGKTDPCEARKLLEPLRTERSTVSRAAIQAMGEVGPCAGK